MKKIVIMGHIDHGKTTLLRAVEAVANDGDTRLINEGDAVTASIDGEDYVFVDCKDDDEYRGKLTGKEAGAVIVVSATEGPMMVTKEAVDLCNELGIPVTAIFMTMADLVADDELLEIIEMDTLGLMDDCGLNGDDIPVIKGSGKMAIGYRDMEKHAGPVKELLKTIADALK